MPTLVLSLLLCAATLQVLTRLSVLDVPNPRSLHSRPVPRGGGVGAAVACLVVAWFQPGLGSLKPALLMVSAGMAVLGMAEDLWGIPPISRLALQVAVTAGATLLLPGAGPATILVPVAVLWIVGFTNAFNFMDGINGISVVQVAAAAAAWILLGRMSDLEPLAIAGLIAGAGALGFLPYNFPGARMFLGDAGSLFFGGWLAATAAWGVAEGVPPEALLAPLALYLADTGSTLVNRIRRRQVWHQPHRDHAYQRLVLLGASHARVDLLVLVVMVACAALGLASLGDSIAVRLAADAGVLILVAWYLRTPRLVEALKAQ